MGSMIHVRRAVPADIPAVMHMKRALMAMDGLADFPCPGEQHLLRHAFGSEPLYSVVVADDGDAVIGMAIYSKKHSTGCAVPIVYLQDLFVEEARRLQGIGRRLVQRVATDARERGMVMFELNVRADNPACGFYRRIGFDHLSQCLTYTSNGPTLIQLAERAQNLAVAI
jgi:ribosomal protein S18 acetylase RimI-like enzyme